MEPADTPANHLQLPLVLVLPGRIRGAAVRLARIDNRCAPDRARPAGATPSCSKIQPSIKASVDSRLAGTSPRVVGRASAFWNGAGDAEHAYADAPRDGRRLGERAAARRGSVTGRSRGFQNPPRVRFCGTSAWAGCSAITTGTLLESLGRVLEHDGVRSGRDPCHPGGLVRWRTRLSPSHLCSGRL